MKHPAALSILLFTLLATREVRAFNPQPDPPLFGLVGIAHGQIASVAVVNVGTTTCNVTLRLLDASGDVIVGRTRAISPGDHGTLDVNADDVISPQVLRGLVRASVVLADGSGYPPGPTCPVSFSVRDSAAATTFASAGMPRLRSTRAITPIVQPSTSQHLHVVLFNDAGTTACRATLAVRAAGGRVIAMKTVSLEAGQHAALDVAGAGERVWGSVALDPASPTDPCLASYELYDVRTGATQIGGALAAVVE